MTRTLSPRAKGVLSALSSMFSDKEFLKGILPRLEEAIVTLDKSFIDVALVENFAKKYFSAEEIQHFQLVEDLWKEIQWIFATCCVYMVLTEDRAEAVIWKSTTSLTAKYPTFARECDACELKLLLAFRNAVRVAMLIMKPNRKKEQFLFIAGRLSGIKEKYITGSGESAAVARRVAIYRKETGVVKEDRSDRAQKRKAEDEIFEEVAADIEHSLQTTPFHPTVQHNFSISATRKPFPFITPCGDLESSRQLELDVAVSAPSLWPITPEGHLAQPGTAFFPSEPFTPTKVRRSVSDDSHFMSSSTDWPQYLPLGTSKDEPPSSPCGDWIEIPVFTTQPLETGVPTRVLAGKDLDLYLTGAGLGEVLLGECFDVPFAN